MSPTVDLYEDRQASLISSGFGSFEYDNKSPDSSSKEDIRTGRSITLTWSEINVWVKKANKSCLPWKRQRQEFTQVLDNVSGAAMPGTLMAIMGSSGAGKTTLLATLGCRIKGDMTGDIRLNGEPAGREFVTSVSGFVPQQELAVESLTAREHLEFMAHLRLDRRTSTADRSIRVDNLLHELNLRHCQHTRLNCLSGGERKRLALAVAILPDPPVLLCDEPTTGLDSFSAASVVERLRLLADSGKTVICTVHQPPSDVFSSFRQLLLLAGGRVAYQGDLQTATTFFHNLGFKCPPTYNPADFYIELLAAPPGKEEEAQRRNNWLCDEFACSSYTKDVTKKIQGVSTLSLDGHSQVEEEYTHMTKIRKPRWYVQFYLLTWRTLLDMSRNPKPEMFRIGQKLVMSLLMAIIYQRLTLDQQGIQDLKGLLFVMTTEVVFPCAYAVLHTFPKELPVFLRESSSGLYNPATYYLSKMVTLIPGMTIEPLLYATVIFWLVGLRGGFTGYLFVAFTIVLVGNTASAYGCMLSAAFESVGTAIIISVPIDMVGMVTAGIYTNIRILPSYISWFRYLSTFYYSNEMLAVNQWQEVEKIPCNPDPTIPCLTSGQEVLDMLGYRTGDVPINISALFLLYFALHFVGLLAIWRRSKKQPVY